MVFSSPIFLFVFLPFVMSAYYLAPRRARNTLLVAASLLFYAWGEPAFVPIMAASILLTYLFGLGARQRSFLAAGIVANLVLLGWFKYGGFLIENLWVLGIAIFAVIWKFLPRYWRSAALIGAFLAFWAAWCIALRSGIVTRHIPLGISFFTFQAMSYLVDVHKGAVEPARNPLRVSLYISLFSQLVAGPILRYSDIAPQIDSRNVSLDDLAYGARRFVIGLGKKVLIADTLAVAADRIFNFNAPTALTAWTGAFCYALQIYYDFSGYSDMAIGLGRLFGFHFRENFNFPYAAKGIRDFWRRWHISLSQWFRDYLYIPLGGSRQGTARTYRNLVLVFLLCGLWHGASWTFVVWGLWHGLWLVAERRGLSMNRIVTLLIVLFGWVLFRSETFSGAIAYTGAMLGIGAGTDSFALNGLMLLALIVGVVGSTPWWLRLGKYFERVPGAVYIQTAGTMAILVACSASLMAEAYSPFIYFRF
jgi:alginate O-acetyltransferase complex protein AlgI